MENGKKATVAGAVIRGNDRAQQRRHKDVWTAMRYQHPELDIVRDAL